MNGARSTWQAANRLMSHECEKRFQNGGPRVYVGSFESELSIIPSPLSALLTLRNSEAGLVVYARRKIGKRYVWRCAVANKDIKGY